MSNYEFGGMLYRNEREMCLAIATSWLSAGGANKRADILESLAEMTDEQLVDECMDGWEPDAGEPPYYLPDDEDDAKDEAARAEHRAALLRAFAEVRANVDEHFPPGGGFAIGARVEAGEGDDHDTGTVTEARGAYTRHPMATVSNVFVAWDSGVSTWTPAADLRLIDAR